MSKKINCTVLYLRIPVGFEQGELPISTIWEHLLYMDWGTDTEYRRDRNKLYMDFSGWLLNKRLKMDVNIIYANIVDILAEHMFVEIIYESKINFKEEQKTFKNLEYPEIADVKLYWDSYIKYEEGEDRIGL